MSYVTDVVVLFDWDGDEPEDFRLVNKGTGQRESDQLEDISSGVIGDEWGGGKYNQCHVLAGAFNYFHHEYWLNGLACTEWKGKPPVICIHPEGGDGWQVWVWVKVKFVQLINNSGL